MKSYTLKDMCKAGRTTPRGVRWWEQQGLLGDVERSGKNLRVFTSEHIKRARIIAACQMCGLGLAWIKTALENYSPSIFDAVLAALNDIETEVVAHKQGLPVPDQMEWIDL